MPEQHDSNKFADRLLETIKQWYARTEGKVLTAAELKKEAEKVIDRRVG